MVVYVTETILYRPEKIIQREDESIIAFYDNVCLPCGINDGHCHPALITGHFPTANIVPY